MSCVHLGRCRSPSAVCASQPVMCASPLSCVPPNITCLSCTLGSVMGDMASLSCVAGRLCHACCAPIVRAVACAVRQSCALSSVLAFTRPSLSWATELSVMASLVQVCHDKIFPAARAPLSCAPKAFRVRLTYSVAHA